MKYAILGTPNCGKTTIFNMLTGLNQKISNWNGVTVKHKLGYILYKSQKIEINDLPGIYTLNSTDSIDEQISKNFLLNENLDCIINVVDASNIRTQLYLTIQLIEMNLPIILVINMIDVSNKNGFIINYNILEKILGCPVIPLIAKKGIGIDTLKKKLLEIPKISHYKIEEFYPKYFIKFKNKLPFFSSYNRFWIAICLIEDVQSLNKIKNKNNFFLKQHQFIKKKVSNIDISKARFKIIKDILKKSSSFNKNKKIKNKFDFDKILINKFLGLPIFFFIIYLVFYFSIILGGLCNPIFNNITKFFFIDLSSQILFSIGMPLFLIKIISLDIGIGIVTIISFIPQMAIMFFILSFLEDSGYIARASYLMDKLMQSINLPGSSFMPLIIGWGCNVNSIYATRIIKSREDRLTTIIMAPFMSCNARLTVFSMFTTIFFQEYIALIIFSLYLMGILSAIITAILIKLIFFHDNNNEKFQFVVLPRYNIPNLYISLFNSFYYIKNFMYRALKLIIPITFIISLMNIIHYDSEGFKLATDFNNTTILYIFAKYINYIFIPIGLSSDNWIATISLLTGIISKEVIISTISSLYNPTFQEFSYHFYTMQNCYDNILTEIKDFFIMLYYSPYNIFAIYNNSIEIETIEKIKNSFCSSKSSMFAYMIFILLYTPCLSVIASINKEANKIWSFISIIWSISLAYTMSLMFYQIVNFFDNILQAIILICCSIFYLYIIIILFKLISNNFKLNQVNFIKSCKKNCCSN